VTYLNDIEVLAIWRFLRWLRHDIKFDGLISDSRDELIVSSKRRRFIIRLLGLIISVTSIFIIIIFPYLLLESIITGK
jgi:hypothetical protein